MPSDLPPKPSELFRERVVARYLDLFQNLPQKKDGHNVTEYTSPEHSDLFPQSSQDTTLTAFAQLGALRLNVDRSLISLIDSKCQYVLAEATRTLSLQSGSRQREDSALFLGGTAIPRSHGVCEILLKGSPTSLPQSAVCDESGTIVVDDLSQDPLHKDRPYVSSGPGLKFYAGIPLVTSEGTQIGVYSVFHAVAGRGLSAEEKRFMRDMAKSTVDHLDALRTQAAYKRRSKLVAGLESFVGGLSALPSLENASPGLHNAGIVSEPVQGNSSKLSSHSVGEQLEKAEVVTPNPTTLWQQALSSGSESMFGRAANIIRQCGDYDGVVFFYMTGNQTSDKSRDSPDSHDGLKRRVYSSTQNPQSASTKPSLSKESSSSSLDFDSDEQRDEMSDIELNLDSPCPILGCSVSNQEAVVGESHALSQFPSFAGRDLKVVLGKRRRPETISITQSGDISADGTSSSGSGIDNPPDPDRSGRPRSNTDFLSISQPKPQKSKRSRVLSLQKLSSTARSFVVLPMWDYDRQRWFACCICWSKTPRKDIDLDGDLQYLQIFGNSIMMSLSRLDATFSDKAKQSFVASISHELRSPLHGILGAVNFLYDTALTRFQYEMIDSISSCGRTLRDTLDHVMDFAKISSFSANAIRKPLSVSPRKAPNSAQKNHTRVAQSGASVCDLCVLVEEVVEAVWGGFSGQGGLRGLNDLDDQASHPRFVQRQDSSDAIPKRGHLRIALYMPYRQRWLVKMQPGALRRIVMNVFGNALKYTSEGLVTLKLNVEDASAQELRVCISITDTGCGISEDYYNNKLFKPFSQENPLASGSGLGLSIVKQITNDLGGHLRLSSTKNLGTDVQVTLTMPTPLGIFPTLTDRERISPEDIRKDLAGLSIQIIWDEGSESAEAARRATTEQARSLKELAIAWCGTDIDIVSSYEPGSPQIVVLLEPWFTVLKDVEATNSASQEVSVIMLASDTVGLSALRSDERIIASNLIIETIAQPVGPRKLAQVFKQILDRRSHPKDSTARQAPSVRVSRAIFEDPSAPSTLVSTSKLQKPLDETLIAPAENSPDHALALIVDDNAVNLRLLGAFMKKMKSSHKEATNGKEALDLYQIHHKSITIILMDISMPVMDGVTATRQIRLFESKHGLSKTPIVALTGLASAAARNEAQEAGMNEYLTKPVNFGRLAKLVKEIGSS